MAKRPQTRMSREKRAKQFMPFSPLNGLEEALASRERIIVPRSELSEDKATELDRVFHELSVGMIVTVIYFCRDEYLKTTGMIAKIDADQRLLQIVGTKISFDDIYDILLS